MSEQKSTEVPLDKVIPAPSNDTDGAEQGIVTISASSRENKDINQDEAAFEAAYSLGEAAAAERLEKEKEDMLARAMAEHDQW